MTDLEKRADEYADKWLEVLHQLVLEHKTDPKPEYIRIQEAYKDGATQETALLSQHILDLQKDKGNLTDRVRELEQQIEKMKCDVLSLIKDRMNDDIDQNIIERLAEKWEIKENE